jgi:hypothetical protein
MAGIHEFMVSGPFPGYGVMLGFIVLVILFVIIGRNGRN